jgi:hypothetical protein
VFLCLGLFAYGAGSFGALATEQSYLFIGAALFIALAESDRPLLRSPLAYVFFVFYFAVVLNSFVYIETLFFPLAAGYLVWYIAKHYRDRIDLKNKDLLRLIILEALLVAVALLALGLNQYIFRDQNSTGQSLPMTGWATVYEKWRSIVSNGPHAFMGMTSMVQLLTFEGLTNLFKFTFGCAAFYVFPVLLLSKFKELPPRMKQFVIMAIVYIFSNLTLFLFFLENKVRYLNISYVLLLCFTAYYLTQYVLKKSPIGKVLVSSVLGLALVLYWLPGLSEIPTLKGTVISHQKVVEFLREKGLQYGYSAFNDMSFVEGLTSGEIQVAQLGSLPRELVYINPYQIDMRRLQASNYTGATFIMLDNASAARYSGRLVQFGEPDKVYFVENYTIFVYEYNILENDVLGYEGIPRNILPFVLTDNDRFSWGDKNLYIPLGGQMYGPYLPLSAGSYELAIDVSYEENADSVAELTLAANQWEFLIGDGTYQLENGNNSIQFSLANDIEFFETVIRTSSVSVMVNSMTIRKID